MKLASKADVIKVVNMMSANYIRHNETQFEKSARISLYIDYIINKYKFSLEELQEAFDSIIQNENKKEFPTVAEFCHVILEKRIRIQEERQKLEKKKEQEEIEPISDEQIRQNKEKLKKILEEWDEKMKKYRS